MEIKRFKSLSDLYDRCQAGEEAAQKVCIGTVEDLGCEHLAYGKEHPKWVRYYYGLVRYLEVLVGKYERNEFNAERELMVEVNMARDYLVSDDVEL